MAKAKVEKFQMSGSLVLVSKRIRQFRESLALSRPKFADSVDVPPTTLKNYELGYRSTGSDFLISVGKVYGAPVMLWMMGFPSTYELPKDEARG
jgi:transcriptional regulator with XRE-family HTH domain